MQVLAPEVDDERHHRHEAAEAEARRVQFDVESGAADQEEQPGQAWAGQRVEQPIGPARLGESDVASEPVGLHEAGEVVHHMGHEPE